MIISIQQCTILFILLFSDVQTCQRCLTLYMMGGEKRIPAEYPFRKEDAPYPVVSLSVMQEWTSYPKWLDEKRMVTGIQAAGRPEEGLL
jgi:hypothetical protein